MAISTARSATCTKYSYTDKWQPTTAVIQRHAAQRHVAETPREKNKMSYGWRVVARVFGAICANIQSASVNMICSMMADKCEECALRGGGLWETRAVRNELTRSSWKANEFICAPLPFKNTHPLWLIHSPKGCSEKLDCELNGRQKSLVCSDTCGSPHLLVFTNAAHSVGLFLLLPSFLPFLKSALTLILICLHLF